MDISTSQKEHFLEKSLSFIEKSRHAILKIQQAGFEKKEKSDQSYVTEADLEAERILREEISKNFPEHGIIGEELENKNPNSEFQWIIDPIDGTQNFAAGIPTFGTILGLYYGTTPLVGVIDFPALHQTLFGAKGLGAFKTFLQNGSKVKTQLKIHDRPKTPFSFNDIINVSTRFMFKRSNEEKLFDNFCQIHDNLRIYYDVFGASLAVEGAIEAMVEFNIKIWDISATTLLIEEAGGKVEFIRGPFAQKPTSQTVGTDTAPQTKLLPKEKLLSQKYFSERHSLIFGKPSAVEMLLPYFQ